MSDEQQLPMPYSIKRHGLSLANCDDEPVHTPGCIQGHGILMALHADDLRITQISENCPRWLGLAIGEVLDQPLAKFAGESVAERIRALVLGDMLERNPSYVGTSRLTGTSGLTEPFDLTLHTVDSVLLLELEPSSRGEPDSAFNGDQFTNIRRTIARLKLAQSLAAFCDAVAEEARTLTGMDRVMVYRFHADESGEVLSDARREDLPSWLGLRYPAHDIPKPAREIFMKIGVRPLPHAQGELYEMVPLINPDTGRPPDMTHCALRGASVMYTEYLKNMGVAASLTMPIMREGVLWGLIACHHHTPTTLPYPMRSAAEFLAQVASLEIAQVEVREDLQYQIHIDKVHLAVLARAAADGQLVITGESTPCLLDGIHADGVALFQRGHWRLAGRCPALADLEPLAAWLRPRIAEARDGQQVYATDALGAAYPPATALAGCAAGLLATAVSRHPYSALVVWFRGEQVQEFNWAGNPHAQPVSSGAHGQRLTPRRSFEIWQEQVRGRSMPWRPVEIEAAAHLRRMVLELVVLRAESLAESNAELAHSNSELDAFAYVAGHDLKEPLRGINKQTHKLLEDAKAGRAQDIERLEWLLRMTVRMDTLLDALLHYAQVGRLSLDFKQTDLAAVLVEATEMLGSHLFDNEVELRVPRPLPQAFCDRARVREIFSNLISNAVKYNDKSPVVVEIGYIGVADTGSSLARPASAPPVASGDTIFYVRDNGIGIEERHHERIFAIFKRLHATDEFGGGSGAGLTIARKMVEQHHGVIWFDSQPGVGSTFYFTLPGVVGPDTGGRDD